ncbi:MAG: hypothetical protein M3O70_07165 [Actinomycetota bacterium]|nr:hypothetical protein [Actinomycetota bacterium]
MTVGQTTYYVVSWIDHQRRDRGRGPRTREYGTASSKQAAIRLAERVLPPDAESSSRPCTEPCTTATRRAHSISPAGVGSHQRRRVAGSV